MRGVILAGGYGTRMAPCTKVTNKHLLPVYTDRGAVPMIHFPIRTLVSSGIQDILIISSREHSGDIIDHLGDGSDFAADFSYKIQDLNRVQLGIASALKLAKNFTRDDNFAVILGDNFFEETFEADFNYFCDHPFEANAWVFLKQVENAERFGVAEYEETKEKTIISRVIEKPKKPPTNMAVTGLYLYRSDVYNIADQLKPSQRGELEITDITNHYASDLSLDFTELSGFWSDLGTPQSMRKVEEWLAEK